MFQDPGAAATIIIGMVSIAVTAYIAIYQALTDSKKYELTEAYIRDLIAWGSQVTDAMNLIMSYVDEGIFFNQEMNKERAMLLAKLSSLMDIGRMYFPNVDPDLHGVKKEAAFRGYRTKILSIINEFFNAVKDEAGKPGLKSILTEKERAFVSELFVIISPLKQNKMRKRFLKVNI